MPRLFPSDGAVCILFLMTAETPSFSRRRFLGNTLSASALLGAFPTIALSGDFASPRQTASGKLTLGTPITHCDWMLKDNRPEVEWGGEGVRHMLTVCKAAGISQIYWRVLDAGRAMYKSRLVLPAEN